MDENFSYFLQSSRLIQDNKHSEEDLNFIYEMLLSIDNETLIDYNTRVTVPSVGKDINLYLKLCQFLKEYFEEKEEYEKCVKLRILIENVNTIKKPKK